MAIRSESSLVITLSPKRVTVAEVYFEDSGLHVNALGDITPEAGTFDGGQLASGDLLGRSLADFMAEKKVSTRRAVMVLPETTAVTQLIKLPAMPQEDRLGAVRTVAERYAIFAEHKIAVDCAIVDQFEENGNDMTNVLLAASREANVEQCQECARIAGLELAAVEAAPVVAARAYNENLSGQVVALAVVGEVKTDIMIFDNGVLKLCYSANAGVTEQPGQGDWMTPPSAEGEEFAAPPQLYSELAHCFRFFQNQYPGKGVVRVIIAADHPRAEEIASQLSQQLQLPVELGRPKYELRLPAEVDGRAAATNRALTVALLRGAAWFVVKEGDVLYPLNLLPSRMTIWQPARPYIKAGVALVAVVLVASILWARSLSHKIAMQERKQAQLTAEIARLTPELELLRAAKATEQALRNEVERETARLAKDRAVRWSQILVDVSSRLPGDMWITQMQSPNADRIAIVGIATNRETIPRAIESLSGSPYLSSVVLGALTKDDNYSPGQVVIRYQINANLLRGLYPPPKKGVSSPSQSQEGRS